MRLSNMHLKTLREVPNEAEIPSHILLLRTGMIRKLVSGVYGFMPLGWRSLRKIEEIIRQEMDRAGGQEIHMSAVQPAELWEESGRWYAYGPELWRLKDRNGRDFCLGPTHEEIFTDIIRSDVSSYRQLPLNLYQIQTKYRDEARPRFGLMRSREFIMKDAYSFDKDQAGLDKSYEEMYEAYEKIFTRCGLTFRPVEADTGAIGGSNSHEFTALSEVGESEIAYCEKCQMAATVERAACVDAPAFSETELPMEEVHTPGTKTIEEVADFLGIKQEETIKALLFVTYDEEGKENGYVAAFVRGDRELNMTKLINALKIPEHSIEFADEEKMGDATGCVGGFTGPTKLHDCTIVVDSELPGLKNLCAGACKVDHHLKNVNYGRDYKADIITDIKTLKAGDPCPVCGAPIKHARGIEVGQVFKLGTKYSESMGATYKDENQQDQLIVMGCYGIGVTRTLAAVVEQHHDENGIIWPMSVAPYHVIITVMKENDETQMELAERISGELEAAGVEVLLDDRKERPGVKFKDADLLGIPVRITVGRGAADGMIEYKLRRDADKEEISAEEGVQRAIEIVNKEK
ncbi:proline--tRNA ligase [Ihubacter massiliensis]|uniref:Proline--tRNA ligase n=1 Tax=Hominibacterium faecale TaxID=2839743 RepID=A0A9J6QYS7_9FIRM|nr:MULTISPECIES: proline--tRNA ligase [Eubacteriales Family XIII. Incertae Sedis]MCI7303114.1 proline--tRNA ligase [Clostridia bacterium]MDE8734447.1 proline--tRNA ligase [Eubacteriales bacterium DFI.9.88]MDY3012331.1 proline--tRNA ligase [Clostridiales Family XIII bacterium]MCO7123566.1 proline--tRNA ligase [Ihubacter massiliensis]MCU7380662.1 proline--tRNA ligase [Hominibacterium faecale]